MKKTILIFLFLISLVSGLSLLIYPEEVPFWIIRLVGIVWILEGVNYALKLYLVYLQ